MHLKKWGWKIQWTNYCWKGKINNEEVYGNKENKEKDNKKTVQNMKVNMPIKWKMILS